MLAENLVYEFSFEYSMHNALLTFYLNLICLLDFAKW